MTLLMPAFFYAAVAVAGIVVGVHFIVTRQPESRAFPTVRFIPPTRRRVTTLAAPRDLLLLLLRVTAILLIGAAFAGLLLLPRRSHSLRIVLGDRSGAVGDAREERDSIRGLMRPGDLLIAFDSAARLVNDGALDDASGASTRQGRLSSALLVALRAAANARERADSIELAIVSPLRSDEIDGATGAIRALWPGRIRLVRVAARLDSSAAHHAFDLRADVGDPLGGAFGTTVGANVRVIRDSATTQDSAWAARERRTLVRWPRDGAPPGWVRRSSPDTVAGVAAGDVVVVYPFERRWQPDTSRRPTRVAARWIDGHPAALERVVGRGCIRDVAIPVAARGDLVLRPSFEHLLSTLTRPCAAISGAPVADETLVRAIAGAGPLASRATIAAPEIVATPLAPWLLGAAILLLLLELFLRRAQRASGTARSDDELVATHAEAA